MSKILDRFKAALVAVFLCLSLGACSTISTLGDYVSENPLVAQIATRQAVAQYIAEGGSIEEENARAQAVQKRIEKVLIYLEGDPKASPADLLVVIDSSIDWSELTYRDRLLVQDIVSLIERELEAAVDDIKISESTRIALSIMFETAISAAEIYLSR